jgi:hypothetical protein
MVGTLGTASRHEASATLGVPTAARTTSDGFGNRHPCQRRRRIGDEWPAAGPGRFDDAGFITFRLDGGQVAHRTGRQPGVGERRVDETEDFLGRGAAAGTDPDDEARRPEHHRRTRNVDHPVGDDDHWYVTEE